MTIVTNTQDRKALARAIAEELGTTVQYLGTPTCGYRAGSYTIDREGNIHGDDFEALRDFLQRNGYRTEDSGAQTHAEKSQAQPVTSMDISVSAGNITVSQLKNLVFTLYAKQDLINRMVQSDCLRIPNTLIERLKENTPDTLEDFISLLDDSRATAELSGFDCRDGKVTLTFPFDEARPEHWTAYANLLNRIYDSAIRASRVATEHIPVDDQNEKYLAHSWLHRLGYGGTDSKAERRILLAHLNGYCAFPNKSKMQAHSNKYNAARRERRIADQEETVLEVMKNE